MCNEYVAIVAYGILVDLANGTSGTSVDIHKLIDPSKSEYEYTIELDDDQTVNLEIIYSENEEHYIVFCPDTATRISSTEPKVGKEVNEIQTTYINLFTQFLNKYNLRDPKKISVIENTSIHIFTYKC
jgi:hypothetical protein